MSDPTPTPNPDPKPDEGGSGGNTPPPKPAETDGFKPITSQDELNRVIGERVARERAKFADYDQLKAKAEGAKTLEDRVAEIEQRAVKAETDALRSRIAAKHGIDPEDADLFLTGNDEATLTRQAERLAQKVADRKKQGNHVPGEGNPPKSGSDDPRRAFLRELMGRD